MNRNTILMVTEPLLPAVFVRSDVTNSRPRYVHVRCLPGTLRNYKAASEIAGSKMPLRGQDQGHGQGYVQGQDHEEKEDVAGDKVNNMLHFVTVRCVSERGEGRGGGRGARWNT